jgi:hypothetical protein
MSSEKLDFYLHNDKKGEKRVAHTDTYSHFFVVLSLYDVIHAKEKESSLKYVRKRFFCIEITCMNDRTTKKGLHVTDVIRISFYKT